MAQKNNVKQVVEFPGLHVVMPVDLQLPEDAAVSFAPSSLTQYINVLRQNWRQGTVGCKDRGEVAFSNKKPWKQKGTGRARVGSIRSPLWRKGGTIFGPQLRTRTLKVSQQSKQNVLKALLFDRLQRQKIVALDWQMDGNAPKTSLACAQLKQVGLHNKKVVLFVPAHDYQLQASCANIPNIKMYLFDQPNAYALSQGDFWVYLKRDSDLFKQMVGAWI
jgi:large subunit ribosomal protein L4